jgi:Tfp pilus assembly protein PilV
MSKGFSMLETIMALTLALVALLLMAGAVHYSCLQERSARLRLREQAELDSLVAHLQALPFAAADLASGCHGPDGAASGFRWQVLDVQPGLKTVQVERFIRCRRQVATVIRTAAY